MRGGATVRTGAALIVALAGAAGATAALPTLRIDDARVVEGSGGGAWDLYLTVTLSAASLDDVSASWTAVDGSATTPPDYTFVSGGNVFFPGGSGTTVQQIKVTIRSDDVDEWTPAPNTDEAFFVQLSSPMNATIPNGRATVTIVDDDRDLPGLQFVSAVADGVAGAGRVRLQWRVPPSKSGAPTDVRVRWNEGSSCSAPATATSTPVAGEFLISSPPLPTLPATVSPAGETQVFEHLGRPLVKHCYALFGVYTPGGTTTEKAEISATPFDSAAPNPVAWTYSTGFPDVLPPTVGETAIYTVSTDGVVHAMTRGEAGGEWPAGWNPVGLGRPAHGRSPIVPLPYGQRLLVGTEVGEVHAVNGESGAIAWSRSSRFGSTQLLYGTGAAQATPAGMFTSFGGSNDLILVGTNATSNNRFHMLDPVTGLDRSPYYAPGSMGGVAAMAAVDYPPGNRVYFLANSTTSTVFALNLGIAGVPAFSLAAGFPLNLGIAATGSPVLRGGRIYFPVNTDLALYRLSDATYRSMSVGDGPIKGFIFPDRRNTNLYFSTNGKVWGFKDTLDTEPPPFGFLWSVTVQSPSMVLHWTGTDYLYVGGGDGYLYQIDVSSGATRSVLLEASKQIGAPSLDGPNGLVLVGSSTGVVYAVRVPF
jgi:hypothetical protein